MQRQLELLIKAGTPLISIDTTDEERALALSTEVAEKLSWSRYEWSFISGLKHYKDGSPVGATMAKAGDPPAALEHLAGIETSKSLFIFKDLGPHCKDAKVHRLVRECSQLCSDRDSAMIFIDSLPLPDEIKRFTVRYEIGWPSLDELEEVVKNTFNRIKRETGGNVKHELNKQLVVPAGAIAARAKLPRGRARGGLGDSRRWRLERRRPQHDRRAETHVTRDDGLSRIDCRRFLCR